jgi:PKD repeat protein
MNCEIVKNRKLRYSLIAIAIFLSAKQAHAQYNPCNDSGISDYYYSANIGVDTGSYTFEIPAWYPIDSSAINRLFGNGYLSRDNLYDQQVRRERYSDALTNISQFSDAFKENLNDITIEYLDSKPDYFKDSMLGDLLLNYLKANVNVADKLGEISTYYTPTEDVHFIYDVYKKLERNSWAIDRNDEELKRFFNGTIPDIDVFRFGKFANVFKAYESAGSFLDLFDTSNKILFNTILTMALVSDAALERFSELKSILLESDIYADPAMSSAISDVEDWYGMAGDEQFFSILFEEISLNIYELLNNSLSIFNVSISDAIFKKYILFASQKGLVISKALVLNTTIGLVLFKITVDIILAINEQYVATEASIASSTIAKYLCDSDFNICKVPEITSYSYYLSSNRLLFSMEQVGWDFWNNEAENQIRQFNEYNKNRVVEVLSKSIYVCNTQLQSNFVASVNSGTVPLTASFQDLSESTVGVQSWEWDLTGNGYVDSREQNPSYTYNVPGTYSVSLTISDGTQVVTETKENYISVVDPTSGNDVAVQTILLNKTELLGGGSFSVNSRIKNVGENSATDFPVSFRLINPDGIVIDQEEQRLSLNPSDEDLLSQSLRVPVGAPDGTYTVQVRNLWTEDGNPENNFKNASVTVGAIPVFPQYKIDWGGLITEGETRTLGGYNVHVLYVRNTFARVLVFKSGYDSQERDIYIGELSLFDNNNFGLIYISRDIDSGGFEFSVPSTDLTVNPSSIKIDAGFTGYIDVSSSSSRTDLRNGYGDDMETVWPWLSRVNSSGGDFQIKIDVPLDATRKKYEFWPIINREYIQVLNLDVHEPKNIVAKSIETGEGSEFIIGEDVIVNAEFKNEGGYALTEVPIKFEITGPDDYKFTNYSEASFVKGETKDIPFVWNTSGIPIGQYSITSEAIVPEDPYDDNSISTSIVIDSPVFTELPELLFPSQNGVDVSTKPEFNWEFYTNTDYFKIQVARSSSFNEASIVIDEIVTSTKYQVDLSLDEWTKYYWRIKSFLGEDESEWTSSNRTFTTSGRPETKPYLEYSSTFLDFGYVLVGTEKVLSYDIIGKNLTGPVKITSDYIVAQSIYPDKDFTSMGTTVQPDTNGEINEKIYVKFYSTGAGEVEDSITNRNDYFGTTYIEYRAIRTDELPLLSINDDEVPDQIDYDGLGFNIGIDNEGSGTLEWSATSSVEWISTDIEILDEGTGRGIIHVFVQPYEGCGSFQRFGNIEITSSNASNSPISVELYQEGWELYSIAPDLNAISIAGENSILIGDSTTVQFSYRNSGDMVASSGWKGAVYLTSNNSKLDGNEIQLFSFIEDSNLCYEDPANEVVADVVIPDTLSAGTYYYALQLDVDNRVIEWEDEYPLDDIDNNLTFSDSITIHDSAPITFMGTLDPTTLRAGDTRNQTAETYLLENIATLFSGGSGSVTFTASSSDASMVEADIIEGNLLIKVVGAGINEEVVTVTITATDENENSAEGSIEVTVNPAFGDLNADGRVNSFDASRVLQNVVELYEFNEIQQEIADISSDGRINSYDASLILQYAVELIDQIPVGSPNALMASSTVEEVTGLNNDPVSWGDIQEKGEQLELPLHLTEDGPVYAIDFSGSFDNHTGSLVEISYPELPDGWITSHQITKDGKVMIALAGATPFDGEQIATLSFTKDPYSPGINVEGTGYVNGTGFTLDQIAVQEIIDNFAMEDNFPNPFNPSTTVRYQLPVASDVKIEMYNIAGQRVMQVFDANQNAGRYTLNIDMSAFSSGVYFIRMIARSDQETFVTSSKMTLIK